MTATPTNPAALVRYVGDCSCDWSSDNSLSEFGPHHDRLVEGFVHYPVKLAAELLHQALTGEGPRSYQEDDPAPVIPTGQLPRFVAQHNWANPDEVERFVALLHEVQQIADER